MRCACAQDLFDQTPKSRKIYIFEIADANFEKLIPSMQFNAIVYIIVGMQLYSSVKHPHFPVSIVGH